VAKTDRGVPDKDPHTMLKDFIEANMESPDGSWTPAVNSGWLKAKKQKTFQIAIQHIYGESEMAHFGLGTQVAMTSRQFLQITLFAPTRTGVWSLFQKLKLALNNGTLAYAPDGIDDYHYIIIRRTELSKPMTISEPDCDFGGNNDDNCIGYRIDVSVEVRWEE